MYQGDMHCCAVYNGTIRYKYSFVVSTHKVKWSYIMSMQCKISKLSTEGRVKKAYDGMYVM